MVSPGARQPRPQRRLLGRRDFAAGVGSVTAPVHLVGGWQDIFLPWMLEDFAALHAAGRAPQLVIGPWTHTSPAMLAAGLHEGLAWLRAHLLGDQRLLGAPGVRVFVTGERSRGGWRELDGWPPAGTGERRLWLAAGARLQDVEPETDAGGGSADGGSGDPRGGDRYRYDPADPTPSLGGPVLLAREPVVDNRALEARPDVLVYTGEILRETVEAIGPVRVELCVRAGSPHFDLFARVCDVDPAGASWNVCDALVRVEPGRFDTAADGSTRVAFSCGRLGIASPPATASACRSPQAPTPATRAIPGTGEDLATATALRAVDVTVLHDSRHPSVLVLPAAPALAQQL